MRKILFLTNSIKGAPKITKITNFSIPSYLGAKNIGFEFHMNTHYQNPDEVSVQYDDIKFHTVEIYRNPFSFDTFKAYKQLSNLLASERFDAIHCNTPIGGILGRVCGKKAKISKIIYTAHGFHFYKGAPLINRTLYKWMEKLMAYYTDAIITINKEDYVEALKFKLRKGGKVYYSPGVGVDSSQLKKEKSKRHELLREIRAKDDSILLISVGELNENKNNKTIIEALGRLQNPNLHYILCGVGPKKEDLLSLAIEYKIEQNIHFFGYRSDIPQLLKSVDIFVMPSHREGLSRSLMEGMSAGLPCIVSKIRGNVDLIENNFGGYLCAPNDINDFANKIKILSSDDNLRKSMSSYNLKKVEQFDVNIVTKGITKIYEEVLK